MKFYTDVSAQVMTDNDYEEVVWSQGSASGPQGNSIVWLSMGAQTQESITAVGPGDRISYGYTYLAAPSDAVRPS